MDRSYVCGHNLTAGWERDRTEEKIGRWEGSGGRRWEGSGGRGGPKIEWGREGGRDFTLNRNTVTTSKAEYFAAAFFFFFLSSIQNNCSWITSANRHV